MAGFQRPVDVTFTLQGLTDLLMNNPAGMERGASDIKPTAGKKGLDPAEVEAEKRAYRDGDGALVFPATGVRKALVDAASKYTPSGKRSTLKGPMAAAILMAEPWFALMDEDGHRITNYTVDQRRVVNRSGMSSSGGSVIRARPLIPLVWFLECHFLVDGEQLGGNLRLIQDIGDTAGAMMGIGDYRPQKMGWYGRFRISRFAVNGEEVDVPQVRVSA